MTTHLFLGQREDDPILGQETSPNEAPRRRGMDIWGHAALFGARHVIWTEDADRSMRLSYCRALMNLRRCLHRTEEVNVGRTSRVPAQGEEAV